MSQESQQFGQTVSAELVKINSCQGDSFQLNDSQDIKIAQIFKYKSLIEKINFNQQKKYFDEVNRIFDDEQLIISSYFGVYLLIMIEKQEIIEIENSDSGYDFSQSDATRNINSRSFRQQIIEYLKFFHQELFENYKFIRIDEFSLKKFLKQDLVKQKIKIFIQYIVKNGFQELSKQFFKKISLETLIQSILLQPELNKFKYSFYINNVYKMIYRCNHKIDLKGLFEVYYLTFKNFILQNQKDNYLQINKEFVKMSIKHNYQFILIVALQNPKNKIIINKKEFQDCLDKKMSQFIVEFTKTQQFQIVIQDNEIFEKFLISNDDPYLIMVQISVFKIIFLKFKMRLTNKQLDQILFKYEQLLKTSNEKRDLYFNHLYSMCSISLMLSQILDSWLPKYSQFQNMSQLYLENAQQNIAQIKKNQTLYLILFQNHHLQEDALINILFNNQDHFGNILNMPLIYGVLKRLWCGNRSYSEHFYKETLHYQILQPEFKIMIQQNISKINLNVDDDESQHFIPYDIELKQQTELIPISDLENSSSTRRKTIYDTKQELLTNINNSKQLKNGIKQLSKYNIFNHINFDHNNTEAQRNYLYQFEVYLNNLNFKKIYQLCWMIFAFGIFLQDITYNFNQMSPAIRNWDTDMELLIQWKIPPKFDGKLEILYDKIQEYSDYIDMLGPAGWKMMALTGRSHEYCDHRLGTFKWHDQELRQRYADFCLRIMKFDKFLQTDVLDIFNFFSCLHIVISLNSVLDILYGYLNHRNLLIKSNNIYDFIIIICQMIIIYNNRNLQTIKYYDDNILTYFRTLQIFSVIIIFLLSLRLINYFVIFKSIGIYIIVLEKILKQIFFFLTFFLLMIMIIGICFHILFQNIDSQFSAELSSIYSVLKFPLGQLQFIENEVIVAEPDIFKQRLMWIKNIMTCLMGVLLLIIQINILIAILSNSYQEVVASTEMSFSQLIFDDYKSNVPNVYYSSINNTPMYLSIFMIAFSPIIIIMKNKKLNHYVNIFMYIQKFLIPYLIFNYLYQLITLPFVYMKILYLIVNGKYQNDIYRPIQIKFIKKLIHFIQFLIFGLLYLKFNIFRSIFQQLKKLNKPCPEEIELTFDRKLYALFKSTVAYYVHNQKAKEVNIKEFIAILKDNLGLIQIEKQNELTEKMDNLCQKLEKFTSYNNNLISIEYFKTQLDLMKNKRLSFSINKQNENAILKMKKMELMMNQFDII